MNVIYLNGGRVTVEIFQKSSGFSGLGFTKEMYFYHIPKNRQNMARLDKSTPLPGLPEDSSEPLLESQVYMKLTHVKFNYIVRYIIYICQYLIRRSLANESDTFI